jgi:hypothetical protein
VSQHALKEWASICKALEAGRQLILLRKGGIDEPDGTFRVAHPRFFLFPTFAHQRPDLLKPEARSLLAETLACRTDPSVVPLDLHATVTASYEIGDPARLERLDQEHVLASSYATERLRWKPRQPLWALVVRVHRVIDPPLLRITADHGGCLSWVDLGADLAEPPADRLVPVLDAEAFGSAAARVEAALRHPE